MVNGIETSPEMDNLSIEESVNTVLAVENESLEICGDIITALLHYPMAIIKTIKSCEHDNSLSSLLAYISIHRILHPFSTGGVRVRLGLGYI